MGNKCISNDDDPRTSKKLWCSKWNKDLLQEDFDHAIDFNDNGRNDGGMGKEVEESFE